MSHFSHIKTQIHNLTSLKSALDDLGIDWKSGPKPVRGYQGQTVDAAVVIEQENGYDIGFSLNGERYELVADLQFWQQSTSVDHFLNKVTQRYAYQTVVSSTAEKGFQVVEQASDVDGSIRLVLQRWHG